jgi:hypothetical protein
VAGLRGLIAVRFSHPDELSRIFEGIGAAGWRPVPARFDLRLSDIPRDGDDSYPFTKGCDGRSSKFFLPTTSSGGIQPFRPSQPYRKFRITAMQRLVRTKKIWEGRGEAPLLIAE